MIRVENVTKKYGNFYALRNVSFEVKDGEIVGFLGRNGAGKSTTMNIITGFIEATSGTVEVGGYDIDIHPKKAKAQIGYMPEGTPLYYELTVREFIKYMAELRRVPKKERKKAVEDIIEKTGLTTVQYNLTKNLSRGFKQRVSLAGTLVGGPKLIILDEPTVGLDPKQVVEIRNLIKSFAKEHTVFISSHILSEISQICDKVIIIDKGEIVAVDTPENLERMAGESNGKLLSITVDDMNSKFESIKGEVKGIKEITLSHVNEDEKSSTYEVTIDSNKNISDIKKAIFSTCAKNEIIILEMKEEEGSLEDAFISIIQDRPEKSQREIEKEIYNSEIDSLREDLENKKEEKEKRKQAIKEEKARKKAAKEAKKEAKKEEKEGGDK